MCSESISILKQLLDVEIKTKSKFNNEDGGGSFNIAENLRLATEPQPRHRAHNDMKKKNNTKRTTSAKSSGKKPIKRLGQIAFCADMITKNCYPFNEILAAAKNQFPKWSDKLARCGIFCARMRLRKAKIAGDWVETVTPAVPAPAPVTEAPVDQPQAQPSELAPVDAGKGAVTEAPAPATETEQSEQPQQEPAAA
jgi:hypothetical protein